jgi:integrase/recombinase XerD
MPRLKRLTWPQAKDLFLTHLRAKNLSPQTTYCYGLELDRLAEFLGDKAGVAADAEDKQPNQVTLDDLRAYQEGLLAGTASRSGRALSGRNVYRVACTLASFYGWLKDEGYAREDPTRRLERPKLNQPLPGGVLTEREVARLLTAAEEDTPAGLRDRAVVELLYASGLRRAELVALDVTDLDLEARVVRVRHGKGDKGRSVPITRAACLRLEAYLKEGRRRLSVRGTPGERALFLTSWGRRMGPATVMRLLHRLARRACLNKSVSPHVLRRSFATHLLKNKANLRSIQLLLGHEKLSTTAAYLRLDEEELRREILRHHPRERLDP